MTHNFTIFSSDVSMSTLSTYMLCFEISQASALYSYHTSQNLYVGYLSQFYKKTFCHPKNIPRNFYPDNLIYCKDSQCKKIIVYNFYSD